MQQPIIVSFEGSTKEFGFTADRLQTELKEHGVDARVDYGALPLVEGEQVSKDLALTILASGASAAVVIVALKALLGPYFQIKAATLINEELIVVRDRNGNPVRDRDGNVVYRVLKKTEISEAGVESGVSSSSVQATAADLLHVKVTTSSDRR